MTAVRLGIDSWVKDSIVGGGDDVGEGVRALSWMTQGSENDGGRKGGRSKDMNEGT